MTTYTIQYRADHHDDWCYSVLNKDGSYSDIVEAIKGLFTNAIKLIDKFSNIPYNEYRIIDSNGEQCIYYSAEEFRTVLDYFVERQSINPFEIET